MKWDLWFIRYAGYVGVVLAILCFGVSTGAEDGSPLQSVLINLATDFFIAGLTVSVIHRILDKSVQTRLGDAPEIGIQAIKKEAMSPVSTASFTFKDIATINLDEASKEATKLGMVDTDALVAKMSYLNRAQFEHIDFRKVTNEHFSELLRFIRQDIENLEKEIVRYIHFFEPETKAAVMKLRKQFIAVTSGNIMLITVPWAGHTNPKVLLDEHYLASFKRVHKDILEVWDLANKLSV